VAEAEVEGRDAAEEVGAMPGSEHGKTRTKLAERITIRKGNLTRIWPEWPNVLPVCEKITQEQLSCGYDGRSKCVLGC
jgi:hypothetical protein